MEMAEKGGAKARLSLFIINVILRDRGMLIAYRLRLPVGWNINTIDGKLSSFFKYNCEHRMRRATLGSFYSTSLTAGFRPCLGDAGEK
jgi:hypothetical protein